MADFNRRDKDGFRYELLKPLGVLSQRSIQGEPWTLEVNLISWNGKAPKIDIRSWNKNHQQMSKGVTLTEAEAVAVADIIKGL